MSHGRLLALTEAIHDASARGTPWGAVGPGQTDPWSGSTQSGGCWLAALDAITNGVIVVDAGLRVVLANATAEGLAAAERGFRLRHRDWRIDSARVVLPCQRTDATALAALVEGIAIAGESGGAIRLHDADGAPAVAALVSPLPARPAEGALRGAGLVPGRALILVHDLAPPAAPRVDLLRDLFGLTVKEAEVARMLAGGATKAEVAEARGLRETTVRTQVRAVLAKTGAANLRDLERMLAGLVGL